MVYGKNCKGNYQRLSNLAKIIPFFPEINNKRSMIYIDNLSEFIKRVIDNKSEGLYFPQNKEYVNTTEMVKLISEVNGKKLALTKVFNPILRSVKIGIVKKVFGDLVYEMHMSYFPKNYSVYGLKESIVFTECNR